MLVAPNGAVLLPNTGGRDCCSVSSIRLLAYSFATAELLTSPTMGIQHGHAPSIIMIPAALFVPVPLYNTPPCTISWRYTIRGFDIYVFFLLEFLLICLYHSLFWAIRGRKRSSRLSPASCFWFLSQLASALP